MDGISEGPFSWRKPLKSNSKFLLQLVALIGPSQTSVPFAKKTVELTLSCFYRYPFPAGVNPVIADWEIYLTKTAEVIIAKQDAEQLREVRNRLYELLIHCIPATMIMSVCT